jgi:hypothetical protein
MKTKFALALLINVMSFALAHAVVIGSDSAVSIQPLAFLPASDTNNRIAGFGWIKNGFELENSFTSCIFDSVFPVSGSVNLNGGTLVLNQDLIFQNYAALQGLGLIVGNNHSVVFCENINTFPQDTRLFQDVILSLKNDMKVQSSIVFQGSCVMQGDSNNIITFSDGASIIVDSNSQLTITNLILGGLNTPCIILKDDTSSLVLNNCIWIQNGDYHLTHGSIKILNAVDMVGSYTFFYDSSQTSTIMQESEWGLRNGMTLSIGKKDATTNRQPLVFTDATSVLSVESSVFRVTDYGIQLTKGTVAGVRDFQVDVVSSNSQFGLVLGDGTPKGDMLFDLYPGASVRYTGGAVVYNVTNGNGIKSTNKTTQLIRDKDSAFWLMQNLSLDNITLKVHPQSILTIAPDKVLSYADSVISLDQGTFTLNGTRYNPYTSLLAGNQSLYLLQGTLPLYTLVASTGNVIGGNGNVEGSIIFSDAASACTWSVSGMLLSDIILHGGALTLASNMQCGSGVVVQGPGTIYLDRNVFYTGQEKVFYRQPLYWSGNNGVITMDSQIALSNTWTFSGKCLIDGGSKEFALDLGGEIVIAEGSTLTIRNAILKGVRGNNIRCADAAGKLILDNVVWQQESDYVFEQGSLYCVNNVGLKGSNVFRYASSEKAFIQSQSTLVLEGGITIKIDTSNAVDLLKFVDRSSMLILQEGASLYASPQPLGLTKGIVLVQGNATLGSGSLTDIEGGISFGDCVLSQNDCVLNMGGGVTLSINSGALNYKNYDPSSLVIQNNLSAVQVYSQASLNAYNSMNMANAITTLQDGATLGRSLYASFTGSLATLGVVNFVNLDPC